MSLLLCTISLALLDATPDRTIADLVLSGYETSMSRIETVRGTLDGFLTSGNTEHPQSSLQFWLSDDRGRFSETLLVPESKGQRSDVAFDAQWEQWLYIRPNSQPYQGQWAARDHDRAVTSDPRSQTLDFVLADPLYPVSRLFKEGFLRDTQQLSDGSYRIEFSVKQDDAARIVLDFSPKHGFRVSRLESIDKLSRSVSSVESFDEILPGLFHPREVRQVSYFKSGPNDGKIFLQTRGLFRDIRYNEEIDPERFTIKFPHNLLVKDGRTGKKYFVGDSPVSGRPTTPWGRWVILANFLLLIIVAGTLLFRHSRGRSTSEWPR